MDVLTFGRSSIDLYTKNVGVPFTEIESFAAYCGGAPLNVAVACSRLGLRASLVSAVGKDKVGDFLLNFLKKEYVDTKYIFTKIRHRTSAVLLGMEPDNKFPLVYYREKAADNELDVEDVDKINFSEYKIMLMTGNSFSKDPCRTAALYAIEKAYKARVPIVLDLDFRYDQWENIKMFGVYIRNVLPMVNYVLGTTEEILSSFINEDTKIEIVDQQISSPVIKGDETLCIETIIKHHNLKLIQKMGAKGSRIFGSSVDCYEDIPGFKVEVLNVLGAGDAFASGFLYGILNAWDIKKSCRMGNAQGAQIVMQAGCANFMPSIHETLKFIEMNGGF